MKILVLCSRVPYPLHDGGNLAVSNLMEGLLDHNIQLSLLSMNTSRHHVDVSKLPALFNRLHQFETVTVDNRIKALPALLSFIKGESYNLKRFISDDFSTALIKMLKAEQYDIIILEGLYVSPYLALISAHSQAKICYRQHNVEFQIWERLAHNTSHPLKRFYISQLAKALKKYELKHINDYDSILAISPIDAQIYKDLNCTIPIIDIPYSLKIKSINTAHAANNTLPKLYHIGAMDWLPNTEAIKWFLEKVWPIIIAQMPEAQLYLAGRNMPSYFYTQQWKNVIIEGEVPDASVFEADKDILIVPLHAGGGIRIKILEAMSSGKAVVATPIAIQGLYKAKHNQELLIADTAADFAAACLSLIKNKEKMTLMGTNAQVLINKHYNQALIISQLLAHFKSILQEK